MNKLYWEKIKDYEDCYLISKTGNVWSVKSEKLLSPGLDSSGYFMVVLNKSGERKTVRVHILVWDTFGDKERNGRLLQVDHIDGDKLNNNINNLQLLSARENTVKSLRKFNTYSQYVGVSWHKGLNKWRAYIHTNGKLLHLGYYENEELAHEAYQEALQGVTNG